MKYDELSDHAKNKVLAYLGAMDHDWYEYIYADAERVGMRITEFDLNPNNIGFTVTKDTPDIATAIIEFYGNKEDVSIDAVAYAKKRAALPEPAEPEGYRARGQAYEDAYDEYEDALDEIDADFEGLVGEHFLDRLARELEYIQSEEAIKETIDAIGYEFDVDGNII